MLLNDVSKMEKFFFVIAAILLQSIHTFCQTDQKDFPELKGSYLGQKPPGLTPEIFAKGIVSNDLYNHCTINISPDGSEIYWAMAPVDTPRRIYFSKLINGVWTRPEIISFTLVEDGDCPVLSPDNTKMFFNSNRPVSKGAKRKERIWCAERTPEGWSDPFCISSEINDEHLHWQVSVDSKENLYFGSERSGSKGRDDVFFAELVDGRYKKPISLGEEINSEAYEGTPYISSDGKFLIFCRDGLWISYKKNGLWTKAKTMGDNFKQAICPYVSPDGKYIFFLEMGIGYNDIYWVSAKIIEELRSKE